MSPENCGEVLNELESKSYEYAGFSGFLAQKLLILFNVSFCIQWSVWLYKQQDVQGGRRTGAEKRDVGKASSGGRSKGLDWSLIPMSNGR